jgi:hypothetical protein
MIVRDRMAQIDTGVILLNNAITTMRTEMARAKQSSDDGLLRKSLTFNPLSRCTIVHDVHVGRNHEST